MLITDIFDEALSQFGNDAGTDWIYLQSRLTKAGIVEMSAIERAYNLCVSVHLDDVRASGVSYYSHPLSVVLILVEELRVTDESLIICTLLHSILKRGVISLPLIRANFGNNVAILLARITRLIRYTKEGHSNTKVLPNIFTLLITDIRIFLFQVCNRLHDLRTISYLSATDQELTIRETEHFYLHFLRHFGLERIRVEVENL